MKFSSLIIGILLMVLVVITFLLGLTNMGSEMGLTLNTEDNARQQYYLTAFNKTSQLQANIEETQNKAVNVTADPSASDILGLLVTGSVDALKTAWQSVDIFTSIATEMGGIFGLDGTTSKILMSILLVSVIIGIFISLMVKKDV